MFSSLSVSCFSPFHSSVVAPLSCLFSALMGVFLSLFMISLLANSCFTLKVSYQLYSVVFLLP